MLSFFNSQSTKFVVQALQELNDPIPVSEDDTNDSLESNKNFETEESFGEFFLNQRQPDKWMEETKDTVSAVAHCSHYVAWASQKKDGGYALFLREQENLLQKNRDSFFSTEGIIQDLAFNFPKRDKHPPTKLVAVDFNKFAYVLDLRKVKFTNVENQWTRKYELKCGIPTSVTILSRETDFELIGVGTALGESFIFDISKLPMTELKKIEFKNSVKGKFSLSTVDRNSKERKSEKFILRNQKSQRNAWNSHSIGGGALDVEFLNDCLCEHKNPSHFHMVVAYKSGCLNVFRIEIINSQEAEGQEQVPQPDLNNPELDVKEELSDELNLNVEAGDVVASSKNGQTFVVSCGDMKIRVYRLSRHHFKHQNDRNNWITKLSCQACSSCLSREASYKQTNDDPKPSYVTMWETIHIFEISGLPLSIAISADGRKVAVGQENNQASIFDLPSGCQTHLFQSQSRVRAVGLDETGKFFLMGGFDKCVQQYNIDTGFEQSHLFSYDSDIQAVSLDDSGKLIAFGTINGLAFVQELEENAGHLRKKIIGDENSCMFYCKCSNQVYVVKLSSDGRIFAFAGYNSEVTVIDLLEQDKKKEVLLRKNFEEKNPSYIWGLDIQCNDENYVLAAGSWDGSAVVYMFNKQTMEKTGPVAFTHQDRVFDVCLSRDSNILLVGTRDTKVFLYDWKEKQKLQEFESDERVYCVAISPDKRYIAFGGVSKTVKVHQIDSPNSVVQFKTESLCTYIHHSIVTRVKFFNEEHLAAVSEDGVCVLYSVHSSTPVLQLKVEGSAKSLAFTWYKEHSLLAIAHGNLVSVYGKKHGYGPLDCPSFELAKDLLKHPASLKVALDTHPTLTNCHKSGSNKSLLSYAVEQGNMETLKTLIESKVPSGIFFEELQHPQISNQKVYHSPITRALAKSNRDMVREILHGITSKKIVRTEDVFLKGLFSDFFETETTAKFKGSVFKAIGDEFPPTVLHFVADFELENCEPHVLADANAVGMKGAVYVGLPFKSPRYFWKKFLSKAKDHHSMFSKSLPTSILESKRIPIPAFATTNSPDPNKTDDVIMRQSPLEVIVSICSVMKDYSVFAKGSVVHSLVMYEWAFLQPSFYQNFFLYIVYFASCTLLSWMVATPTGEELCNNFTLILSVLTSIMSLYFLYREWLQFDAELKYTRQHAVEVSRWTVIWRALRTHLYIDPWNLLDFLAFFAQLVTNVLVLACVSHAQSCAAVSMLLLSWRAFFYARAFKTWGPFVRIIQRTLIGMWKFLLVLFFWLLGFALAFNILLNDYDGFRDLSEALITVLMMMYGDFDKIEIAKVHDWSLSSFLFQIMMLSCVVTMLNLLVAILSDTYNDVKDHALQESVFQLAQIVVELKRMDRKELESHKWIHILSPVRYHRNKTDETEKMLKAQNSAIKSILEEMKLQNSKIETILNKID